MALVHVADFGLASKRVQQVNSTQTENCLLAEPVVRIAAIQVVREMAIPRVIPLNIGIQQKHRDDVAGHADDIEPPGLQRDLAILHHDRYGLVGQGQRGLWRPDNIALRLLAGGVQVLLEVAAAVHQRDRNQRNAGIRSRTQRIAGQHAQTTRVGRQRLGERDLHGEVRDLAA